MSRTPNDNELPPYAIIVGRSRIPGVHAAPIIARNPIYSTRSAITSAIIVPPETLVITGTCPICGIGFFEDYYPCFAILYAVLFFPFGILCCLAMKCRRCSNCGFIIE